MPKAAKKRSAGKAAKAKAPTKKSAKKPLKRKVEPIPSRYSRLIPSFRVPGCAAAVDFLVSVFGAKVTERYDGPNGELFHCELRVGDVTVMCGDGMPGDSQTLAACIYVKDCDAVFQKAVGLGAQVKQPVTLQFYGDKSGRLVDRWGNEWIIATHVEDVSKKEMERRMQAATAQAQTA